MAARVVLDTNVYVSAYGFGGAPARLLRGAIEGDFDLVVSPPILAEVARVLADKIGFDQAHIEDVVRQIVRVATVVSPDWRLTVVADEPDNRVLECAVAGGAGIIVSGDRHLLALGTYAGVRTMAVGEAADALLS